MSSEKKVVGTDGKRIALSNLAYEFLEIETKRIKEIGQYFKINESKLASTMIELFISKYLSEEREQIEEKFLDKKLYLKFLIENSKSEEELLKALNAFSKKPKTKQKKMLLRDSDNI
jgi:hypothetical protein